MKASPATLSMSAALGLLYVFLYGPIGYVIYTSFAVDIVWPFPPSFTLQAYADLLSSSLYSEALVNSLMLATGAAVISTLLAGAGAIGILRFRSRYRKAALLIFIAPLFVADLLIGISVLAFNARVLGLPGNLFSAMAANAIQARPEVALADKHAGPAQRRGGRFLDERESEPDGARTRHDQHRGDHRPRVHDIVRREPPAEAGERGDRENTDKIAADHAFQKPVRIGVAGDRPQQLRQQ